MDKLRQFFRIIRGYHTQLVATVTGHFLAGGVAVYEHVANHTVVGWWATGVAVILLYVAIYRYASEQEKRHQNIVVALQSAMESNKKEFLEFRQEMNLHLEDRNRENDLLASQVRRYLDTRPKPKIEVVKWGECTDHDFIPMGQTGLFLSNSGSGHAYDVAVEPFIVEETAGCAVRAFGRELSSIHTAETKCAFVWIDGFGQTDERKWMLLRAMQDAANRRYGTWMYRPNSSWSIAIVYRSDTREWFKTTAVLTLTPAGLEVSAVQFHDVGHTKPTAPILPPVYMPLVESPKLEVLLADSNVVRIPPFDDSGFSYFSLNLTNRDTKAISDISIGISYTLTTDYDQEVQIPKACFVHLKNRMITEINTVSGKLNPGDEVIVLLGLWKSGVIPPMAIQKWNCVDNSEPIGITLAPGIWRCNVTITILASDRIEIFWFDVLRDRMDVTRPMMG